MKLKLEELKHYVDTEVIKLANPDECILDIMTSVIAENEEVDSARIYKEIEDTFGIDDASDEYLPELGDKYGYEKLLDIIKTDSVLREIIDEDNEFFTEELTMQGACYFYAALYELLFPDEFECYTTGIVYNEDKDEDDNYEEDYDYEEEQEYTDDFIRGQHCIVYHKPTDKYLDYKGIKDSASGVHPITDKERLKFANITASHMLGINEYDEKHKEETKEKIDTLLEKTVKLIRADIEKSN